MRVVTDRELAMTLARRSEPVFYSHFANNLHQQSRGGHNEEYVIGRRYRGLFDAYDGSYVTVTSSGETELTEIHIEPSMFYSTVSPVVSTDMRLIVEINRPQFNFASLSEYLSAAYLTAGGRSIKISIFLMPNEKIYRTRSRLFVKEKKVLSAT